MGEGARIDWSESGEKRVVSEWNEREGRRGRAGRGKWEYIRKSGERRINLRVNRERGELSG